MFFEELIHLCEILCYCDIAVSGSNLEEVISGITVIIDDVEVMVGKVC